MIVLTTERLSLRPLAEGDAPALFALLGDPVAMQFWDRDPLPRLATAEALLADEMAGMARGDFMAWMAIKDGEPIGSVDLSRLSAGEAGMGFVFSPLHWGHGLAGEAVAAVIAHAFGAMGLMRLQARVQTGNQRAIRLLRRLEFTEGELLPGHVRRSGRTYDCALFRRARSQSASAKGV